MEGHLCKYCLSILHLHEIKMHVRKYLEMHVITYNLFMSTQFKLASSKPQLLPIFLTHHFLCSVHMQVSIINVYVTTSVNYVQCATLSCCLRPLLQQSSSTQHVH